MIFQDSLQSTDIKISEKKKKKNSSTIYTPKIESTTTNPFHCWTFIENAKLENYCWIIIKCYNDQNIVITARNVVPTME